MKPLITGPFIIFLLSCSAKHDKIRGHWHEIINGETAHCYHITDTLVSVDKYTFGFSRKVEQEQVYAPIIANSSFGSLADVKWSGGEIIFGDSIRWVPVSNDLSTFIDDLSLGLMVKVVPPEIKGTVSYLIYGEVRKAQSRTIYVGRLKEDGLNNDGYYIQINDDLVSPIEIVYALAKHSGNYDKTKVIIHADRGAPDDIIEGIVKNTIWLGYSPQNIFRTALNKRAMTLELININE